VVGCVACVCERYADEMDVRCHVVFPCVGLKDRCVCPHKRGIRALFV
jgi:hypothetical protein